MCHHLVVECFRNLPHQQAMHFPKPLASSHRDAARNLEAAMCLGHQRSKAATPPFGTNFTSQTWKNLDIWDLHTLNRSGPLPRKRLKSPALMVGKKKDGNGKITHHHSRL